MTAKIVGVGGFVPSGISNNHYLACITDTSDEKVVQRAGIKERRILGEGLATSDMIVLAVEDLLSKSDVGIKDIDCLIVATCTPDMPMPSTATIVCRKLKVENVFSFDLNSTCSGFIYALRVAASLVESERFKNIIVAGADTMSKVTNLDNCNTNILFGDGAGVVLLQPCSSGIGLLDSIVEVKGKVESKEYMNIEGGVSLNPLSYDVLADKKNFIKQNGKIIFKNAVEKMTEVCEMILKKNNVIPDQIDWFVPHQANHRIITAVGNNLKLDSKKVLKNVEKFGNTTSASIPLCLWEFQIQLKRGDLVLLSAFGAGFTWGAALIEWAYN